MAKTNPNGANQYTLDPRQKKCWEDYINPKSKTFGNAYQSALGAGYEDNTAKVITTVDWFLEKVRRLNLLSKAEKVLDETLDLPIRDENGKLDASITKTRLDAAKFTADRLGKHEGYSTKTETDITSGGEPIHSNLSSEELEEVKNDIELKLKKKLGL